MGTRAASQDTLIILLEIMRRIPRHSKITVTELAKQLKAAGYERDDRTFQRHLKTLSENFDIECDARTTPYGYSWKPQSPGFMAPNLGLHESLLLELASQQLKTLLPPTVLKSMEGFFKQARSNMGRLDSPKLEKQWMSKVRVVSETQPLLSPKIEPTVLEQVSEALFRNHLLDLDYTNAKGENKNHRVMPLGLAQQGPRIYLVCRFEGYDNERSMALHRIHKAKSTGFEFKRPDFNLASYDEQGRFGVGDGQRIQLKFDIEKGAGLHLLESQLSTDQKVAIKAAHYQITATVMQTQQLDRWLNSFGGKISNISKIEMSV
jgi:predicted DNA-binding transcriptional regulator YafY